jgi:flagella basal body P-ring formation protein FlgA
MVDAIFQNGALSISFKVEVLEDGQPGQSIRIRNPRTRREFFGKVQNERTITVAL